MKQAEIVIGMTCYANICGELAAVVVLGEVEPSRFDKGKHTRYRIRRENSNTPLSKPRTAAALRLEKKKFW